MQTSEVLSEVRRLEISTRRLVDGLITGNYRSVFKGSGIEFSEIRQYVPGDDVRNIDWNVTARFDEPFVKEYIEERDVRLYVVFDISASGLFGSAVEKRRQALTMAASLLFAGLRSNDNVGLFLFTDRVELFVPARKGKKHVLQAVSRLVSFEPASRRTDLSASLAQVSSMLKKRSVLFVISDFFGAPFEDRLRLLAHRHDVVAVRTLDPREQSLPDVGLIELEDEETGEQLLVDTSDESFRRRYAQLMRQEQRRVFKAFAKTGVDALQLFSDQPFEVPLRQFFAKRLVKVVR